jgi:CBS-domain-containing membrane protein
VTRGRLTVGRIMRRNVDYLRDTVWADSARTYMRSHGFDRVVVVDGRGRPRGVAILAELDAALVGAPIDVDVATADNAAEIRPLLLGTVTRRVPVMTEDTPVETARASLADGDEILIVDRERTLVGALAAEDLRHRPGLGRWS